MSQEVDSAAFFDLFMYLNIYPENETVNKVLNDINIEGLSAGKKSTYDTLNKMVETYPELGEYKITNYNNDLKAALFQNPHNDGTQFLAFKGTGDGRWMQSITSMYGTSETYKETFSDSVHFQKASAKYYD